MANDRHCWSGRGLIAIVVLVRMVATAAAAETAFPGRAWEQAAPESQGIDRQRLGEAVRYLEEHSGRGAYGFNWWVNGLQPDGLRRHPDLPGNLFWAAGHNNNFMFVVPDCQVVIVRLGLDQETDGRISVATWNEFLRRLSLACSAE
jgi:hypothetical protein